MYETSLHYLQPDQGINQKRRGQSLPHKGIQYPGSEAKKTYFMYPGS